MEKVFRLQEDVEEKAAPRADDNGKNYLLLNGDRSRAASGTACRRSEPGE